MTKPCSHLELRLYLHSSKSPGIPRSGHIYISSINWTEASLFWRGKRGVEEDIFTSICGGDAEIILQVCSFKRNEEVAKQKVIFSISIFRCIIYSCLAGRSYLVYCESPSVAALKLTILVFTYCILVGISLWINPKLPVCEYLCISVKGGCLMQLLAHKCLQDQGRLIYSVSWG